MHDQMALITSPSGNKKYIAHDIPSAAKPCGDKSLEETTVGGGCRLASCTPWGEMVHDCLGWPASSISISAPPWGVAGEVWVPRNGGDSSVEVWGGSTPSMGSSTGGKKMQ